MNGPDIFSAEYAKNPYPFYKLLRDEYPLYYHEPTQSYLLSRYDDVVFACKSPAFSSESYAAQMELVHGRTIMQMEGREHTRYRTLLNPALRGTDLRTRFVHVIERTARDLIDDFRDRGEVDLVQEYTALLPVYVIVEMMALPREDVPLFHGWYRSAIEVFANFSGDPAIIEKGKRTNRELRAYMRPVIEARRANPGDDLVSTLCTAVVDGTRMDDEQLCAFISLLLTAGGETTDRALAQLFQNLIDHPAQMQRMRQDRSLVTRALAESLRRDAPAQMISRLTTEDVEVTGGVIPANSMVLLLLGSANRDERRFSEPERFNIFRDEIDVKRAFTGAASHTSFGLGRHFCIGSLLAKMEMEISTNQLLDAMGDIRYRGERPQPHGFAMRGHETMPVTFTPTQYEHTSSASSAAHTPSVHSSSPKHELTVSG